jgi:hypothetical protein
MINTCKDVALNGLVLDTSLDVTKIDISQHPEWDATQWFDWLQQQKG